MKKAFASLILLSGLCASAQKIVFSEPYKLNNNVFSKKLLSAKIVEDSNTKNRALLVSGMKEASFYSFDAKWKLLQRFSQSFDKKSALKNDYFSVIQNNRNGSSWDFILKNGSSYTRELVDFGGSKHTVGESIMEDMNENYRETVFSDERNNYIMYLSKGSELKINTFSKDFSAKNFTLQVSAQLPLRKSEKYNAKKLYEQMEEMDSMLSASAYFTRRKVHFYPLKEAFALLVAADEPVAELSFYNKQTGAKIKSDLFSVEEFLATEDRKKDFNSSALLFHNMVFVLAAHKNGGVFAVFDAATKKSLYHLTYSDKDNNTAFNYPPVTYETLPGTINLSKLTEKVEDISMNRFCTEMFKHSCAITAKRMQDNRLLVTLANYDQKELAAATSTLRSGMNTMTSMAWYVNTSAGIILDESPLKQVPQKTTWQEVNKSDASGKYEKVAPQRVTETEYSDKKAFILNQQVIGSRKYTVYFYDGELKIDEKELGFEVPKMFNLSE